MGGELCSLSPVSSLSLPELTLLLVERDRAAFLELQHSRDLCPVGAVKLHLPGAADTAVSTQRKQEEAESKTTARVSQTPQAGDQNQKE